MRDELHNLISDVFDTGLKTINEAKKEFKSSEDGKETISDKYVALRKTIQSDRALIEKEKKNLVTVITQGFVAVKNAVEKNNRGIFDKLFEEMDPGSPKEVSEETKHNFAETIAALTPSDGTSLSAPRGLVMSTKSEEDLTFENLLSQKTAMSFFETKSAFVS